MYLVDTSVISEARKGRRANLGVVRFFRSIPANERYLSVQTVGEIRRGIENIRGRGDQAQPVDKQIAAIALIHGLEVVTRNVQDFSGTGLHPNNPFT